MVVCRTITQHIAVSISSSVMTLMTLPAASCLSLPYNYQLCVLFYFTMMNDCCYLKLKDYLLQAWITSVHDQKLTNWDLYTLLITAVDIGYIPYMCRDHIY